MTDPITEADLLAFVDDQLDVGRRIEVEDHLAARPDIAARMMADLRARDALRLALRPALPRSAPRVLEAARQLERSLVWRRIGLRFRRAAAVVLLVGAGWFAHAQVGLFEIADGVASPNVPAFVEDALHAHETALIRARMLSQREVPHYDPAEIRAETGIAVPTLPRDWRVVDAQLFPSRSGHSLELALETAALGRVSLFAARAAAAGEIAPTVARSGTAVTAYWQAGEIAYALTGAAPEAALERAAARLVASLP